MRVTYNKLVRDRIPEMIEADGHHAVTRILDRRSYRAALLAKLGEEAREAQGASADELPGELADVWEVLQALLSTLPMTWQDLQALAATKRDERGGFEERIFLEYTEQSVTGCLEDRGPVCAGLLVPSSAGIAACRRVAVRYPGSLPDRARSGHGEGC